MQPNAGVRGAGVRKAGCARSCDVGGNVSCFLFVWTLVLHAVPQRAMDVGISPHHRLILCDRIVASSSVRSHRNALFLPRSSCLCLFVSEGSSVLCVQCFLSLSVRTFIFGVASVLSTRHVCAIIMLLSSRSSIVSSPSASCASRRDHAVPSSWIV
jgi:hypothetical protein